MFDIRVPASPPTDPVLLEKIFTARPLLKRLLEDHGTKSLKDFFQYNLGHLPQPPLARKQEFLRVIAEMTTELFGEQTASAVTAQLDQYYAASSADHHGTINSSLAVNANMLLAGGVVLSCASVSLNNEDYPRGLLFHTKKGDAYTLEKLSLLPSNAHNSLVYNFRPYRAEEVAKVEKSVNEKCRAGDLTPSEKDALLSILSSIYRRPEILSAPGLCEQFTLVNYYLWRSIFRGKAGMKDLLYLPLEEITTRLLVQHHFDTQTPLYRMLFDPSVSATFTDPLQASMETYLRQGALATHFFWGISEKNYRLALRLADNHLVSDDGSFSVLYTPEAIQTALKERRLMPNLCVAYTLIHLYYGFNCFGGFNQIHYLDAMRKVYNDSEVDEVPALANSQLFGYGFETIFFPGTSTPVTALDLLLHGDARSRDEIQAGFSSITVSDAFRGLVPIVQTILD